MSIYGEGNVRSPHFLSAQMSLIELWRTYPRILEPFGIASLMKSGQLVYDEKLGKCVEPPSKVPVESVVAKKRTKRGR